jgi:hypothetical protein
VRGDSVRNGLVATGNRSPNTLSGDIGPGSYQDSHYRGSPTTVASTMLHGSHNVKIKAGGGKLGVTIPHA